jgi:hypothetical protein
LLGIPALALYGFAAVRYGLLFRRRRRGLLLAVAGALELKGKQAPVEAFVLVSVAG